MDTRSNHKVNFKAGLSNGETVYEGKGDWEVIPGQPSPWQRLQRYLAVNKLEIRSLALYTEDGRTFQLPSNGKGNPNIPHFKPRDVAYDFNMFRAMTAAVGVVELEKREMDITRSDAKDLYTVIEAVYPGDTIHAQVQKNIIETHRLKSFTTPPYKLQLWVDEHNTKNCWTIVVPA